MSFRKLVLKFSITKDIVLISYQTWVRSYPKHSGSLIKQSQPEVITFFFFSCLLCHFSGLHKVWCCALICGDKQEKRYRERDIPLCHFAFGLHISLSHGDPGLKNAPLVLLPAEYIFNHFFLPLCLPYSLLRFFSLWQALLMANFSKFA